MQTRALQYLERDVLENIVALKMLKVHDAARVFHQSSHQGEGVMILLDPDAFEYDRTHYPNADLICIISSDHPELTAVLLEHLDFNAKIVFKLKSQNDVLEARKRFELQRVTSFLSFTDQQALKGYNDVKISTEPSSEFYEWIATERHTRDWFEPLLREDRAFSCELYDANNILKSVCFAFENYGQLWEIGGVYTHPTSRGQGWASRAVSSTIAELQHRGKRSRYQVHELNKASIRVAERSNLELFLTITHWF